MNILIIEDEYSLADAVSETLKEDGFSVTIKTNGEDGEDEALTENYDLILVDVMLPRKNGGEVTLNLNNQKIDGDILVDSISTLDMTLKNGSSFSGCINNENTAKTINITLDSSSSITLTKDTYVTSLNNEVEDNSNIDFNGYKLYVNGTAIN